MLDQAIMWAAKVVTCKLAARQRNACETNALSRQQGHKRVAWCTSSTCRRLHASRVDALGQSDQLSGQCAATLQWSGSMIIR
ncbi:hypothetical protein XavaCFBP5823_18495 [Xanthomonas axonopodis pv. vasculorum]|nr:hypothetical protein XavaCFBP5823_18495 [Xanthomonas axonopodis pv. vasculorum]